MLAAFGPVCAAWLSIFLQKKERFMVKACVHMIETDRQREIERWTLIPCRRMCVCVCVCPFLVLLSLLACLVVLFEQWTMDAKVLRAQSLMLRASPRACVSVYVYMYSNYIVLIYI